MPEFDRVTGATMTSTADHNDLERLKGKLDVALDATGVSVWELDLSEGTLVLDANGRSMFGIDSESVGSFKGRLHNDDVEGFHLFSSQAGEAPQASSHVRIRDASGVYRTFLCKRSTAALEGREESVKILGTFLDVDAEEKSRQLLSLERSVLARLASDSDADVYQSLEDLASGIESIWGQVRCAINLHNPAKATLHVGAAPSLPEVYAATVEGFHLGDLPTVCGLAIEKRGFAFIPDFANAPKEFDVSLPFYEELNVNGCWSMPIFVGDQILGTCCIFTLMPREPNDAEIMQLERLSQACGMLIEGYRQKQERNVFEAQVRTKDRLEGLGKLAGGIAHDFNNLLTVVVANAELIASQSEGETRECANQTLNAANVAAELCDKILTYAGDIPFQLEPLIIDRVLNEIVDIIQSGKPKQIALDARSTEENVCVLGDHAMLSQLILNLVTNAIESIEDRGHVRLTSGTKRLREEDISSLLLTEDLRPGEYAFVSVEDSGRGIDAETLCRVFDPFFSTKPSGSGLGLSTVFGAVQRHRGGIDVATEVGQGTTFTVFLPLATAKQVPVPTPEHGGTIVSHEKRLALVDDEMFIRDAIQRVLVQRGFDVLAYPSGEEMLDHVDELRTCHFLMLDLKMPGIDGVETYRRVRSQLPNIPVCFMSGATSSEVDLICHDDGHCELIRKPFRSAEFDEMFQRLCDVGTPL